MKKNEYILENDHAILRIFSKTHGTIDSKIDVDKIEDLKRFQWHVNFHRNTKSFYVQRKEVISKKPYKQKIQFLHQYLLKEDYIKYPNKTADHLNRNPLDNRLSNLQMKTSSEQNINQRLKSNNTSGFRGVDYDKQNARFRARIRLDNKLRFLGLYQTADLAAAAYNLGAILLHQDHAQLNETTASLSEKDKISIVRKIAKFSNFIGVYNHTKGSK